MFTVIRVKNKSVWAEKKNIRKILKDNLELEYSVLPSSLSADVYWSLFLGLLLLWNE